MADDELNVIDEEDAHAQRTRGGVPVTWQAGGTSQVVGRDMLVQKPTARELKVFQNKRVRTCATCKHFAQAHMKPQLGGFMRRLWEEWGPGGHRYVGDRPDRLGRCREDAELAVGPNSLACDHYNPKG